MRKNTSVVQAVALEDKPFVVLPLVALALVVNMFLFNVAYTNASFNGAERAMPDPLAQLTRPLDEKISVIAENLTWAVSTAAEVIKPEALALLGLEDYKFGMPRFTALAPQSPEQTFAASANTDSVNSGQVLGASIQNPEYIVIQLK
jgi:hypothetical protein